MTEISRLCTPVVANQEDVGENRVTARWKRESLQMASCIPVYGQQDKFSRLASLQGSNHSQLNSRSNMTTEKHEEGMPKLAEVYQFPGFSENIRLVLPHNTSFATVVSHVVRAQRHLANKPKYKVFFQNLMSLSIMEDLVTDFFWWLWLHNFKPDANIQDKLFARVSVSYVRILYHNIASRKGDTFLKCFPDTLAQTLYCCFCCCFPQSCSTLRSEAFLTKLCSTAYQWTGGICPAPGVYECWDFEALEPDDVRHTELVTGNDTGETKNENTVGPDNITHKKLKALTHGGSHNPVREYPPTEFRQSVFNLHGNSPLVTYYMQLFNMHPQYGMDVLVSRTEITKFPPYPFTCDATLDSVTYADPLGKANERSAADHKDLRAMRQKNSQRLHAIRQTKLDEHHKSIRS
ncbi:protein FAM227A-like [Centroberyx gerrardi]